jgi:serine/threonine-protein kinase
VGRNQGSWWKALDALEPTYLAGMDNIFGPVFSPDGRWVAFSRDGRLWKQPFGGEAPVPLLDSISDDFNPGIAWLPGVGILYEDRNHGLRVLNEEDGTTDLLATAEEVGQVFHARGLPTGEGVVVTGCDGWCESANPRLSYVDLERDTVIPLRSDVWMAWPMSDGRLVMVDGRGALFAAPFDPTTGTLGSPVPLMDGIRVSPFPDVAVGADGSLLYIAGEVDPYGERLVWVDRDGRSRPVARSWPGASRVRSMSLSPDGERLALGMRSEADSSGEQVWIKELPDGALSPLTMGPLQARRPVWSPDGQTLAFITQTLGADSTWQGWVSALPADASSHERDPLLRHDRMIMEVALTQDWRTAVVRMGDAAPGDGDIAFTSMADRESWQGVVDSGANEYGLALSPDGRWMAYVSEASGLPQVYVRPFPGPGPRVQVSRDGGVEPRWAHSGREIFFRSLRTDAPDAPNAHTGFMMVASVSTAPTFRMDSTSSLFGTAGYVRGPRVPLYEVTPDDQRFIMVTRLGPRDWSHGEVVYSRRWYWSDAIQERLGG